MKNAFFVAPKSNRLSCASAVKCPYSLTLTQWTTRENDNSWRRETLILPFLLPWKCYSGHIMELCDECNNCTKFQFHAVKVLEDALHFLWFYIILRPDWHHKSSTKSKPWITQEPRVLLQKNKCHYLSLWNKKDLCHIHFYNNYILCYCYVS